jgi:hypothetical protein
LFKFKTVREFQNDMAPTNNKLNVVALPPPPLPTKMMQLLLHPVSSTYIFESRFCLMQLAQLENLLKIRLGRYSYKKTYSEHIGMVIR